MTSSTPLSVTFRLRAPPRYGARVRANAARITADQTPHDFVPVVKLFTPDPGAIWLLTELDPDDVGTAFGLCGL